MSEFIDLSVKKSNKHMKRDEIEKSVLGHHYKIMPAHQFRLGIFGPSGSGKSNLLIDLLTKKLKLFNYFHKIYIFSPTFQTDDTWAKFIKKHERKENTPKYLITEYFNYPELDTGIIEEIFNQQHEHVQQIGIDKSDRILFVFDDVLSEKNLNSSIMKKLFYQSRHANLSLIIASQTYSQIPKPIRLQLSNLIIFLPSKSMLKNIAEDNENIFCDCKMLEKIIMDSCSKRYGFLHINKQSDAEDWYRSGWDEIYNLKK